MGADETASKDRKLEGQARSAAGVVDEVKAVLSGKEVGPKGPDPKFWGKDDERWRPEAEEPVAVKGPDPEAWGDDEDRYDPAKDPNFKVAPEDNGSSF